MTFSLPAFDLDAFVAATLAEDLGDKGDIPSAAVIPADARFRGVMDSRDAITVAGLGRDKTARRNRLPATDGASGSRLSGLTWKRRFFRRASFRSLTCRRYNRVS